MGLKWRHAGQACITANRVYVQSGIYQQFAKIIASKTSSLTVGHGSQATTTMGPVTTPQSLTKALSQVEDAKSHGGQIFLGGNKIDQNGGYFFEPTIITGAKKEMLITQEETFGPVLALYEFETEEEAVRAANDTSMGLASYFFTKDVDRTWRLLEDLEAGMIGMNTGEFLLFGLSDSLVSYLLTGGIGAMSAAESPFGGIKESGYGKESGMDVAIDAYLITKTGTLTLDGHY
jgi:succinate-semialdehyde dehydrogenase/glutarate-semialdehyde dehydrogenase